VTANGSSSGELQASRLVRAATKKLSLQEQYTYLLKLARRTAVNNDQTVESLDTAIAAAEDGLKTFREQSGGRIASRRRPAHPGTQPELSCSVYLDECGAHSLSANDKFGAFALAAIIIPDAHLETLDADWKAWKRTTLGAADALIHEPDVRRGDHSFWLDGDRVRQAAAISSLSNQIASMQFEAVVCVVNRADYLKYYGRTRVDDALPEHLYLMALTFLMERIVMVLDQHYGGARARVFAESREKREDALLQYEYVRLHLDGTSFVAPSWFRHQLEPTIHFRIKKDNLTGLQLADLVARPCAEKVLAPESTPNRWSEVRSKLAPGKETAHSILGLKIFPWDDRYQGIWIS